MMGNWFKMLFVVVIGLCAIQATLAKANSSKPGNDEDEDEDEDDDDDEREVKNVTIAWVDKPPYVTSPTNGSIDDEAHGLIREALLRHIKIECGWSIKITYDVKTLRTDSEFGMIELLRQNKVHIAAPIFEPTNRRYSEFPFFKLVDYPGTDFITTQVEIDRLSVVLDAVLKSWPLLAVTLILTAIAGVIMWALVRPV